MLCIIVSLSIFAANRMRIPRSDHADQHTITNNLYFQMNENGPKFNHQDAAQTAASQESPRGLAELQPIPPQNLANLQPASNLSELTSANPLTDMQSGGAHLPPLAAQVSTVPQPHQSLPATDSQHQSSVSHPNPALLQSHPVLASQQLQAAQQLQTLQSGPPQNTLSQSYSVNHQQHASPIQQHQAVLQQQHNSQLQRQQQPHSAVGHQQPGMIPNHVPKVEPDVKTEPGPLPSDPTMQVWYIIIIFYITLKWFLRACMKRII